MVELDVNGSSALDAPTVSASARARAAAWRGVETASHGQLTREGLRLAAQRLLPVGFILFVLLAAVAVVKAGAIVHGGVLADPVGFDFRGTLWEPSKAIVNGQSPYPEATVSAIDGGNPALYPPLLPIVVIPLTAMPWAFALATWTCLLAAAVILGLRLTGIRDWRCYAIALSSPLVLSGLVFGNLALLLVLGVCVSWRWRERPMVSGLALGLTIAAKIVTWPLLLWLLVSRRYRACGWAGAAAAGGVLIPWAMIGFTGLGEYPSLLRLADRVYGPHGNSLAATAAALGVANLGFVFCLGAAGLALLAAVVFGRRHEFDAFAFTVLAAVVASPVSWPYSFALLLAPLAAARPRFSYAWALFAVLFVVTARVPHPTVSTATCCRPADTPLFVWYQHHLPPSLWLPLAFAASSTLVVLASIRVSRSRSQVSA